MEINTMDWLLANISCQRVYDFYDSKEAAEREMGIANTKRSDVQYTVMTWDQYSKGIKEYFLSLPIENITKLVFDQMLDMLPPIAYYRTENFESFLFSEHLTVPFTHQYFKRGRGEKATYHTKVVSSIDKSTWVRS